MNEAEKELVVALRSGKYQQTQGFLHDGVGYCCLGVACDIHDPDVWVPSFTKRNEQPEYYIHIESCSGSLPDVIRKKLGWAHRLGTTFINIRDESTEGCYTLADLNDDGFTFHQIADIIEAGFVEREEDGSRAI